MKPICRNCHFLSKEIKEHGSGRALVFTLNAKEREYGVPDPEIVAPHYSLNCHMGVWDESVSAAADRNAVLDTDRGSTCFFFPHNPAMLFAAAKELQKRIAENQELKRSSFYTRVGLWVAAAALALNALVELLKHV